MDTRLFRLDDYINTGSLSGNDLAKLKEAAGILAGGGLVAFPTETVYGLGGDAERPDVAGRIYAAKGRPSDNPLIVHIAESGRLREIAEDVPESALKLAEKFWPGPLTMVLKKSALIPPETTGGLDTVAVRFPSHPAARNLIKLSGAVIAAPSANISGRPSTTSAIHCLEDLSGRIDAVVDGGSSDIGLESTIIDLTGERPALLRPGAVTLEMLKDTLGAGIDLDPALSGPLSEDVRPKAPGMKYRHYAPKADMVLVVKRDQDSEGDDALVLKLASVVREHLERKEKTALLCSRETYKYIQKHFPELLCENLTAAVLGERGDRGNMARLLFDKLRETDALGVQFIAAEGCGEDEIGMALMNRLKKAAAWQIVYA